MNPTSGAARNSETGLDDPEMEGFKMADDATIELECDACDRTFPASREEPRATCPHCGDVNRVPTTGATPTDMPNQNATAGENLLRTVRPALVRGQPVASLCSGLLAASSIVLVVITTTSDWPGWLGWVGGVGLLVALLWMLWLFVLGHRWDRLRITTHRTIDERGIVMRSTSEVLHVHVRNLRITQSIWQRIVGIGDLEIDSAAGDGEADITIRNVPDPDGIKRLVDRHRGLGVGD